MAARIVQDLRHDATEETPKRIEGTFRQIIDLLRRVTEPKLPLKVNENFFCKRMLKVRTDAVPDIVALSSNRGAVDGGCESKDRNQTSGSCAVSPREATDSSLKPLTDEPSIREHGFLAEENPHE